MPTGWLVEGEGKHRTIYANCINVSAGTALITILISTGHTGGIYAKQTYTVDQSTISQVTVMRDWAVTLDSRKEPGLLLMFTFVAITAASRAFLFALSKP